MYRHVQRSRASSILRGASRTCLGVGFALFALGGLPATSTSAAAPSSASISNVSFRAPVHTSYDHSTGGGAWNTGGVTYVKGELEGTDFKCGDIVSYMLQLNVPSSPHLTPPLTARISITYGTDTTGQSGVALDPLPSTDHLLVNAGSVSNGAGAGSTDTGMSPNPGTASVLVSPAPAVVQSVGKPMFSKGSTAVLTFLVGNLSANSSTIVRSDAAIRCLAGSRPTGNLQASLTSVNITSPSSETINAGNQTINLKVVGNVVGVGSPLLTLVKTATTAGGSCPGTKTITVENVPAAVRYCYAVTNLGTDAATSVTVTDDNATPGTPGDDFTASVGNVPAGGSVYAHADGTLAAVGAYTNTASASSTNGATSNTDTATVTVQKGLGVSKTQTSANPTAIGDTITYHITATNSTDATTYTNVVPTDANGVIGTCSPASGSSLAPGDSMTCNVTHVVTADDAAAGTVDNQGAFDANNGSAIPTHHTNTVTTPVEIPKRLAITIDSPSRGRGPVRKGQKVTYTITATNTSDGASVPNVNIVDPNATITSCVPAAGSTLAPGDSMTCEATHEVTTQDETTGVIENGATATGGSNISALAVDSEVLAVEVVTTNPTGLPNTGSTSGALVIIASLFLLAGLGLTAFSAAMRRRIPS